MADIYGCHLRFDICLIPSTRSKRVTYNSLTYFDIGCDRHISICHEKVSTVLPIFTSEPEGRAPKSQSMTSNTGNNVNQ